jgi:hypothetical protein
MLARVAAHENLVAEGVRSPLPVLLVGIKVVAVGMPKSLEGMVGREVVKGIVDDERAFVTEVESVKALGQLDQGVLKVRVEGDRGLEGRNRLFELLHSELREPKVSVPLGHLRLELDQRLGLDRCFFILVASHEFFDGSFHKVIPSLVSDASVQKWFSKIADFSWKI